MDADLKAKWVAKLRSGEVKQCKGVLKDRERYCCLGVLAEVECPGVFERLDRPDLYMVLPTAKERGIDARVFDAPIWDIQKELASMNDSGKSFAEIADYIEANL